MFGDVIFWGFLLFFFVYEGLKVKVMNFFLVNVWVYKFEVCFFIVLNGLLIVSVGSFFFIFLGWYKLLYNVNL